MKYIDSMTLKEARDELRKRVAEDDSKTYCPCCGQRARDDRKGMTKWQVLAVIALGRHFAAHPGVPVHAATLVANTDADRDHGVALLRHWGFIKPVQRPAGASNAKKGSRGLSGFYGETDEFWRVVNGGTFHKNIAKDFGKDVWTPCGPMVTLEQVYRAKENTDENHNIIDGTTSIPGIHEMDTLQILRRTFAAGRRGAVLSHP